MAEAVHVHRLRLQHPLPALPMAPQPWVEDALRCAAVPAAWRHRWVLVKRLQLRLGTRTSSAALADALGEQWQQLAARALPAERAPDHAAAVWFADEPAARVAWLRRRLQGAPLRAWFWQQVQPVGAALADDVAALLQRPWREAVGAAREQAFRQQVLVLCAAVGSREPQADGRAQAQPAITQRPLGARVALAAKAASASGAGAADMSRDARSGSPEPMRPKAADTPTSAKQTPRSHAAKPKPAPADAADSTGAQALARAPGARHLDAEPTPAVPAADRLQAAASAPVSEAFEQTRLEAGLPTAWAGFFFVLNLWRRLPPPDGDTALVWLHALAAWLRVPPEDGVAAWLDELGPPQTAAAPPLRAWRLQALQQTRLPLRRLLAAPGQVRASRTHVDLHLPLRSARLAVRKAGLDIDPGWQPLLQRVVAFHYDLGAAP